MGDEGSPTGWDFSASGMAAVWAEDNTREAILQAFKRREVYATTGPRIVVRFDGGWYPADEPCRRLRSESLHRESAHRGSTRTSVPMGADLPAPAPAGQSPGFAVSAMKDPKGANLDRIQIIKGWVDAQGDKP